jgi:dolichol-phosphate mannosyltransferase
MPEAQIQPLSESPCSTALLPIPTGPLRICSSPAGGPARLRLSVVVPTYNEAQNIAEVVQRLSELLDGRLGSDYEIVVVDDDSPDRTWDLALALTQRYPRLRVMRRAQERGLSTAVVRGWQVARGDVLAVIDADLQHPPEVVMQLWDQIERGADLAVASRHIDGGGVSDWSFHRRVLSRAAQMLGLAILPNVVGRVSDPMSGYFMLKRSCLEGVELNPLGYKILIEILGRGRVRWIGEVPYVFRERAEGASKVTWKVYVDYFHHLLRLRLSTLPVDRFVRFAVVGFSGVILDMGLLYLLSDPSMLGWGLTRSKLIAAETAIINNFLWNDTWTFADLSRNQRAFAQRVRRFAKFQLICLAGLVFNTLLLNLLFNIVGMNRYLANAIAIAAVTGWNFWLNLKLSWRVTKP